VQQAKDIIDNWTADQVEKGEDVVADASVETPADDLMEDGAVLEDAPGRDAHGSTRYKTPERKKAVKRSVAVEDGPETLRRRMNNQMDDDEGVSLSPGGDQSMQNDGSPGQQWYDSEIASGSNANVDMQDDGNNSTRVLQNQCGLAQAQPMQT
jgi:hypothetical protein